MLHILFKSDSFSTDFSYLKHQIYKTISEASTVTKAKTIGVTYLGAGLLLSSQSLLGLGYEQGYQGNLAVAAMNGVAAPFVSSGIAIILAATIAQHLG